MTATLFTNVRIIDGSGEAPFAGEVLVKGNRIAGVARDGATIDYPHEMMTLLCFAMSLPLRF